MQTPHKGNSISTKLRLRTRILIGSILKEAWKEREREIRWELSFEPIILSVFFFCLIFFFQLERRDKQDHDRRIPLQAIRQLDALPPPQLTSFTIACMHTCMHIHQLSNESLFLWNGNDDVVVVVVARKWGYYTGTKLLLLLLLPSFLCTIDMKSAQSSHNNNNTLLHGSVALMKSLVFV